MPLSTAAVLLGPYARHADIDTIENICAAAYAFNLGIHRWAARRVFPEFLWITEKKLLIELAEHPQSVLNLLPAGADTTVLIPWQLEPFLKGTPPGRIRLVNLDAHASPECTAGLSLQAAAVWQTISRGYKRIDCIGFDHFFRHAGSGILHPGFLPNLSPLLSWPTHMLDTSSAQEHAEVFFHQCRPGAAVNIGCMEKPPGLCNSRLVIPIRRRHPEARGARTSQEIRIRARFPKAQISFNTRRLPLVSLLMCVKNAARTIRHALDSVAAQTYPSVELVVVEGDSSDGTLGILQEYERLSPRIVSGPDDGYYDALNKAVQLAHGDYLLAVNGDDSLSHVAVERLVQAAIHSGSDITAAHATTIDDHGLANGSIPSFWNASCPIRCPLRHGTMLVKRETYDRVGPYDISKKVISDRLWMERALKLGITVSVIDEHLLRFRTSGISSLHSELHIREIDQGMLDLEPSLNSADQNALRFPWETGTEVLVSLCKRYPLSGRLRQAITADRRLELFGSTWPKVSVAPLPGQPASGIISACQKQTLQDFEIIVCSSAGGSDLSTLAAVAERDLRVIHIAPGKTNPCRAVLEQAIGDYLIFPPDQGFAQERLLQDVIVYAAAHRSPLVYFCNSQFEALVRHESDGLVFDPHRLIDVLLRPAAGGPLAGLLIGRDIYKRAIDFLHLFPNHSQHCELWMAMLIAAAFNLPPWRAARITNTGVKLRAAALQEAMSGLSRAGLIKGSAQANRFVLAAHQLLLCCISSNHRVGINARLQMASLWNEAARDSLTNIQAASPGNGEHTTSTPA